MLMARLQRSRGRCLTIFNMKKDIHPKYYEEAKVMRTFRRYPQCHLTDVVCAGTHDVLPSVLSLLRGLHR